jgi:hypothetical protein
MTDRPSDDAPDADCRDSRRAASELAAALSEVDNGTSRLRTVVMALIGRAAQGDVSAIREIFDRVDGKALPSAAGEKAVPTRVTFRWMTEAESKASSE